MRISVIQSRLAFAYDPKNPGSYDLEKCTELCEKFLGREFEQIERVLKEGSNLVVTIEGFNATVRPDDDRYHFPDIAEPLDGELMKRFLTLTRKYGAYIVAGLYTSQNGKAYNSAVLFGPEGIVGVHNKVHLPAGEENGITPGDKYEVFETEFGNIGMLVCWDLQYPEAARELALKGADIIACPTWGCESIYVNCRAYENSVTLAVAMGVPLCDTCYPSCIIDNMGNTVAVASRELSQTLSADIDIKAEPAPQYGSEGVTGHTSMRHTRAVQRRPDTYKTICEQNPPILNRYL